MRLHTLHWYISVVGTFPCSVCSSRVPGSQQLSAGIFHIYAGNRLRVDDGSVFVGFMQTKSPSFNYQGLIVCEVLLLVFGFCFTCSAFVVGVQAMVYHFYSLQMVLVHIVKSNSWVIESSRNANLFVVPKRGCPIFKVKGLYRTERYVIFMIICILIVVGAFFPWALAAVHLPVGRVVLVVSLLAFVISFV